MLRKITINNVASYRQEATLETDKEINLIYGLNGVGKSVLARYLYSLQKAPDDKSHNKYQNCSIALDNEEILVYSQKFVEDNFREGDQKGIFTLSEGSIEAEEEVKEERAKLKLLKATQTKLQKEIAGLHESMNTFRKKAKEQVWEVKKSCEQKTNALGFCLVGFKSRDRLFNEIVKTTIPERLFEINELARRAVAIQISDPPFLERIPAVEQAISEIESDKIFQQKINLNASDSVANTIRDLGNESWVATGLRDYINNAPQCPFCQQDTLSEEVLTGIRNALGHAYREIQERIEGYDRKYEAWLATLSRITITEDYGFVASKELLEHVKDDLIRLISLAQQNSRSIREKVKDLSNAVRLLGTKEIRQSLSQDIEIINTEIQRHNAELDNKEVAKESIKRDFWKFMRQECDQSISLFLAHEKRHRDQLREHEDSLSQVNARINATSATIREKNQNVVSTQGIAEFINRELGQWGISDFRIEADEDKGTYAIRRIRSDQEDESTVFGSLSEGEKTLISFLYFVGLSKGSMDKDTVGVWREKIVVIDDPISSLSHAHVFNVSQTIAKEFFRNDDIKQTFVLTHNLYFFDEVRRSIGNSNKKLKFAKCFRVKKNAETSQIQAMKWSEVRQVYHELWGIVAGEEMPVKVVANCMRQILEYFFRFTENKTIQEAFQEKSLNESRHAAFNRAINKESHFEVFDVSELDRDKLWNRFQSIFEETGYINHYNAMMRKPEKPVQQADAE